MDAYGLTNHEISVGLRIQKHHSHHHLSLEGLNKIESMDGLANQDAQHLSSVGASI